MGGDDSQKLRPWRGIRLLSGAQQTSGYSEINTLPRSHCLHAKRLQFGRRTYLPTEIKIQSVRKLHGQQLP
jgi:hypothetical protein